jgi:hypothetical protein
VAHIRFQCERLAVLHRHRPRWLLGLTLAVHQVFFAGVTLAIWAGHRRALRAGGYSFPRFWATAWRKMRFAWRIMSPALYHWPANLRSTQSTESTQSTQSTQSTRAIAGHKA